ncbi:hypothetical protein J4462_01770 [Candidatus Pacearchaeota archaeon]|nr:hypothetical protein [Candidatus Pacearchaeota archaeon]
MQDEIIAVYEKRNEIEKIVEKLKQLSFEDLQKTLHLEYSLAEKATDLNLLKQKFTEFNRIKLINKRKHKKAGKFSYDFYYELDDGSYILYAITLEESKPKLLNAFHVQRNFRKFRQILMRAYKNVFLG